MLLTILRIHCIYFNLEDFSAPKREQESNKGLEKLNLWLQLNKLTLSVDKTKGMYCTNVELCLP